MTTKKDIQRNIRTLGSDFKDVQTVRLGRLDGVTVETDTVGLLWARQWNGKEIQIRNQGIAPAIFDLRVLVGIRKTQPGKWFILEVMDDYLTSATSGQVAYHHVQHEEGGADRVNLDRKQIGQFSVRVLDGAGFLVRVGGGVFPTTSGTLAQINTQTVDLSSYAGTASAMFVNIETDDTGTLSTQAGSDFGSPLAGSLAYIPVPDPGKTLVCYILIFTGQTELLDEHIVCPMPLGVIAKSAGLQIDDATADTPLDADELGFWDVVDAALKKITWANIKATLKTYFDTIYSALGHTHTIFDDAEGDPADVSGASAADGTSTYAARRDHVHYLPGGGGVYTDENAQDAVGAMLADTDTVDLTYTDATPELKADVKKQMSIISDASGLKLDGDSATPGNNKVYGTNGSGVKGWKADPSGGSALKTIWVVDAPPASPTSQDDEFDDGSLDAKWSEFDPNNVLTVSEDATYKALILTQSTRTGDNVTGIYQTLPAGNFTIWTRVAMMGQRLNYQLAGLCLWENPSDVSKSLMITTLTMNASNIMWEILKLNNHNSFNSAALSMAANFQPHVYQRMRRNGTNYYHAWSLDGIGWYEFATAANPLATPTKFGLFLNNSNSGATFAAKFSCFRYVASDVGSMGVLAGQLAGIYQ